MQYLPAFNYVANTSRPNVVAEKLAIFRSRANRNYMWLRKCGVVFRRRLLPGNLELIYYSIWHSHGCFILILTVWQEMCRVGAGKVSGGDLSGPEGMPSESANTRS